MTEHVLNPLCFPHSKKQKGNSPHNLTEVLREKQRNKNLIKLYNITTCMYAF